MGHQKKLLLYSFVLFIFTLFLQTNINESAIIPDNLVNNNTGATFAEFRSKIQKEELNQISSAVDLSNSTLLRPRRDLVSFSTHAY